MTTLPQIPRHVPAYLTTGEVARVLRLSEATVQGQLRRGRLPYAQAGRSGWRRVAAVDLATWAAACGYTLDWSTVPVTAALSLNTSE